MLMKLTSVLYLALNVHEYEASSESDGHDDQLGPEGPLQVAHFDLVRSAVDQNVKRP